MDERFYEFWEPGRGLWTFIIVIVLISSFFGYLRARSRDSLIKEALRSGQEIDPSILRSAEDDADGGGLIIGGMVTLAAALGVLVLGYQIGAADGDQETFEILKGVAAIPGFIGIALIISGLAKTALRSKKD